jgi:hypothetical protein
MLSIWNINLELLGGWRVDAGGWRLDVGVLALQLGVDDPLYDHGQRKLEDCN